MVSWLPTYHDMGLIYGVLQPLYKGFPSYLMSPSTFLQSPILWLEAISRYRASHTSAPNFAFELCVRRVSEEQRRDLDLQHWKMVMNGAEPIRRETLDRFAATYAPYGFDARILCPGYGLAEATLKVSSVRRNDPISHFDADAERLERHELVPATRPEQTIKTIVGCGFSEIDTRIVIVDPKTCQPLPERCIGEIWVQGKTVAKGYWNRPQETAATFQAYLTEPAGRSVSGSAESSEDGTSAGPFLRTGDYGFLEKGELFITGRMKDLIIIRGLNHYPQDIEHTVEGSYAGFRPGCCAAFSVPSEQGEALVVVQEVHRQKAREAELPEILEQVCRRIGEHHGLQVQAQVLIAQVVYSILCK